MGIEAKQTVQRTNLRSFYAIPKTLCKQDDYKGNPQKENEEKYQETGRKTKSEAVERDSIPRASRLCLLNCCRYSVSVLFNFVLEKGILLAEIAK